MSISDELNNLEALHARGALSAEEYARAKRRVLGEGAGGGGGGGSGGALNVLRRSRSDRWLGGVCGGVAAATDTPPWLWRLAFTLSVVLAGGGILLYVLLWIFVPQEDAAT